MILYGKEKRLETRITPHISHRSREVKISDHRCRLFVAMIMPDLPENV
jgi:hypothetical protein